MTLAKLVTTVVATLALLLTPDAATAADEEQDRNGLPAELAYVNGTLVTFDHSDPSGAYGLIQGGQVGRAEPIVNGEVDSLLEAYLEITPQSLPVPEPLVSEPRDGGDPPPELKVRRIVPPPVRADGLAVPGGSPRVAAAAAACPNPVAYPWVDWFDAPVAGMAPKTYYSSNFGGRFRYSDSKVVNCTPLSFPDYLWARHRVYYRNIWGNYKKHHEGKVKPWHWEKVHKGSIKRYRKVHYDDAWNSSPSCGQGACKYGRQGRFHN